MATTFPKQYLVDEEGRSTKDFAAEAVSQLTGGADPCRTVGGGED